MALKTIQRANSLEGRFVMPDDFVHMLLVATQSFVMLNLQLEVDWYHTQAQYNNVLPDKQYQMSRLTSCAPCLGLGGLGGSSPGGSDCVTVSPRPIASAGLGETVTKSEQPGLEPARPPSPRQGA